MDFLLGLSRGENSLQKENHWDDSHFDLQTKIRIKALTPTPSDWEGSYTYKHVIVKSGSTVFFLLFWKTIISVSCLNTCGAELSTDWNDLEI